ncbi:MAG: flippase [Cyanobacteria bacterium P01_A01_bin.114]
MKTLQGQLAKTMFGTFGLKISSLGLSFITSIFLSRLLGAAGYGTYAYAVVWLSILNIPATLGLRELMVREVAVCHSQTDLSSLRGLLLWANRMVLGVSIAIALLAAIVAYWVGPDLNSIALVVFLLAMTSLPLKALTALRQATLQGLHRVVIGQMPELALQPFLFVLVLGGTYLITQAPISVVWIMGFRVATVLIAFLVGTVILSRTLPSGLRTVQPDYRKIGGWLRSVLPFILISATVLINTRADAIMLGALQNTEAVGIYTVVTRGADFVTLVLIVTNQSIRPKLARLYAAGQLQALQNLVTKTARLTATAALPIALFLIVFGQWYLWLFGPDFLQGRTALALLGASQLLGATIGSVGLLLSMTGHERDTSICVAVSAIANILLNLLLIPRWGINGAAAATLASNVLWNLSLSVLVYKRLKIKPSIFGKIAV